MIGKVIEGRYAQSGVYKLPDKNVLFIQTEDGDKIAVSKSNVISVSDVTEQYGSSGGKMMMVMWNDFETSIIQLGMRPGADNQPRKAEERCGETEDPREKPIISAPVSAKKKTVNRKRLILVAVIAAVIAASLAAVKLSEFERVKNEVVQIAGRCYSGKGYFTIDTYPDEYKNMDSSVVYLLLPDTQADALEGIRYANEALGFNGAVYSQMMETNALMGRQSEENRKYRVTWSYHPDEGLEVTYEKK